MESKMSREDYDPQHGETSIVEYPTKDFRSIRQAKIRQREQEFINRARNYFAGSSELETLLLKQVSGR